MSNLQEVINQHGNPKLPVRQISSLKFVLAFDANFNKLIKQWSGVEKRSLIMW